MSDVKIIINAKIPKNAILIEGFQGVGLVGTLAAQYLVDKKKAEIIGYMDSLEFPPIAILSNGIIRTPIRIHKFKNKGKTFIVFESELPIPQLLINKIATELSNFAKKNKIKEIISLEGLAIPKGPINPKTHWVSNMGDKFPKFKKESNLLKNGVVIGVSASLLIKSKINKIPAIVLMAEAHPNFPDGIAAANIIKLMNKIYNLGIDTSPLEKESKKFEDQIWGVIRKANQLKKSSTNAKETYIG